MNASPPFYLALLNSTADLGFLNKHLTIICLFNNDGRLSSMELTETKCFCAFPDRFIQYRTQT